MDDAEEKVEGNNATLEEPNKPKKKTGKRKKKSIRTPKYDHIRADLFAAYFSGNSPADIARMYDMPMQSVYSIKRRMNWDERKAKINELARQRVDIDLAVKKSDIVKISGVLVSQAGSYLMKLASKSELSFRVSDFVNLVKNYQLVTGEVTERYGVFDKEMVRDIVKDMTPQERAIIVTLFEKMEQRMKVERLQKEEALK